MSATKRLVESVSASESSPRPPSHDKPHPSLPPRPSSCDEPHPSLPPRPSSHDKPHPSLPPRPDSPAARSTSPGSSEVTASRMAQGNLYRPPHLRLSVLPWQRFRRKPYRTAGIYGGLFGRIEERRLDDLPTDLPIEIEGIGLAGGYKWITGWSAHDEGYNIAVPGLPDIWRGDENAVEQVLHDAHLEGNTVFADYNGASTPAGTSPHEAVFLSLVDSEVLRGVQLITARNNLKKLLVSCSRNLNLFPSRRDPRVENKHIWRIEAWVVPGTSLVLLDRWDPPERRRPSEGTSYHLAYHEATTAKLQLGSDRTPGCQRLISYSFGGIKMIVKCDIDAAFTWEGWNQSDSSSSSTEVLDDSMSDVSMPTAMSESGASDDSTRTITGRTNETGQSMITSLDIIASLSNSICGGGVYQSTSTGLRVHQEPLSHPPHENLISIKTRQWRNGQSLHDVNHADEIFSNIFWSQVPTLMVGWHNRGDFSVAPPSRFHLGQGLLKETEDRQRPAISQVRALLEWILRLTRDQGRVAFVCDGQSVEAYKLGTRAPKLSREAWEIIREAGLDDHNDSWEASPPQSLDTDSLDNVS